MLFLLRSGDRKVGDNYDKKRNISIYYDYFPICSNTFIAIKIKKASESYIATGTFCEQAKVKYSTRWTSGSATMAVYTSYTPNFDCDLDGNQKGALNLKVGLITYDEVIYAGGYYGMANSNYYLINGFNFLTMSPAGFDSIYANEWRVRTTGSVYDNYVDNTNSLRPVINLTAGVLAKGTGTKTDPYVIKTN